VDTDARRFLAVTTSGEVSYMIKRIVRMLAKAMADNVLAEAGL
jgi:hypothetical protein